MIGFKPMSIILVDKDTQSLNDLKLLIKGAGYQDVITSCSLSEALREADKGDDDVTASNINLILINLSSEEIAQECFTLKEKNAFAEIPIIAITCPNKPIPLQTLLESGITECISDARNEIEIMMRIHSVLTLKYEIKRRRALERNINEMARQLEHSNHMLQLISSQDGLTGIANRRYFDQFLSNEWRRAIRNGSSVSLIMIDIDFFKAYNDFYGHLEGDECLKRVAQEIQKTLKRSSDIAARYGGEEFAAVLPGTDLKGAAKIAELIQENIISLNIKHEKSSVMDCVTVSLGVASEIPAIDSSHEELIKKADSALYKAKQWGRNRIVCWHKSLLDESLKSVESSCNIEGNNFDRQ